MTLSVSTNHFFLGQSTILTSSFLDLYTLFFYHSFSPISQTILTLWLFQANLILHLFLIIMLFTISILSTPHILLKHFIFAIFTHCLPSIQHSCLTFIQLCGKRNILKYKIFFFLILTFFFFYNVSKVTKHFYSFTYPVR